MVLRGQLIELNSSRLVGGAVLLETSSLSRFLKGGCLWKDSFRLVFRNKVLRSQFGGAVLRDWLMEQGS